ncbi:MAG: hypothetical protein ACO1NU_09770 [Arcticibacter sp.]
MSNFETPGHGEVLYKLLNFLYRSSLWLRLLVVKNLLQGNLQV